MLIEHTQKLSLDLTQEDEKGAPVTRKSEPAELPLKDLRGVMRQAATALMGIEVDLPEAITQEFLARLIDEKDLQRKARQALCRATPRLSLRDFMRRMARHFETILEVQAEPGDRVLIVQTKGETQRTSWTKKDKAKVVAVHEIDADGNLILDLHPVAMTQRTTASTAGGLARGTCSFAALVVRQNGSEYEVRYAQILPDVWSAHTRGHYNIVVN